MIWVRCNGDGSKHICDTGIEIDGQEFVTAGFDNFNRVTSLNLSGVGTYQFAYTVGRSGEIQKVDVTKPDGTVFRLNLSVSD